MSSCYRVAFPIEGRNRKARFRPVGVMFLQKDGARSAFTPKLASPIGAIGLILFEPKNAPDDPE